MDDVVTMTYQYINTVKEAGMQVREIKERHSENPRRKKKHVLNCSGAASLKAAAVTFISNVWEVCDPRVLCGRSTFLLPQTNFGCSDRHRSLVYLVFWPRVLFPRTFDRFLKIAFTEI